MTFTSHLLTWTGANLLRLSALGDVSVRAWNQDRNKASVQISLERADRVAELVVWSSGEVESSFVTTGDETVDRHFDVRSDDELTILLEQMVAHFTS